MLDVEILTDEDHGTSLCVASPAVIGRGDGCEIRLRHWRVARRHARLDERIEGVFVEDLGSLGGTLVNGRRILQYGPLLPEDEIVVGAVMLRVRSVGISGEDVWRACRPPGPWRSLPTRRRWWNGGGGCMRVCSRPWTCGAGTCPR